MNDGGVVETLEAASPKRTTHSSLMIFFLCKYVVDSRAMMPARLWMIYIDFGRLITIVRMYAIYESLNNTFLLSEMVKLYFDSLQHILVHLYNGR
jgi:hypothetical protein